MNRSRGLNSHQETGTLTGRRGDEFDKVFIATDMRLSPDLEKTGGVVDLRCYGDIIVHDAKFAIKTLYTKDCF